MEALCFEGLLRHKHDNSRVKGQNKPSIQLRAHKGDIEARYSNNKGVLPPDIVEDMRKAYKECEPFLLTSAASLERSDVVKEAKIDG